MDRAEHLKKRLEQEKEGKKAIFESMCLSSCDKACFIQCFWLCPLELCVVWTVFPWELTGLLCISNS